MEVFVFRSSKQKPGQTLDDGVTELSLFNIAHETDSEEMPHEKWGKSLDIVIMGHTLEIADSQAQAMEDDERGKHKQQNKNKNNTREN